MPRSEYQFTLILSGIDALTDEVLDRLYEAGCDDALIGSRDGVVFADFSRVAPSLTEAVLSAARDLKRAKVGAQVVHVEPDDIVTMAEIARRLGVSREAVRKWVTGVVGPGRFPPPFGRVRQKSPLWRWTDVLTWYRTEAHFTRPGGDDQTTTHTKARRSGPGAGRLSPQSRAVPELESAADVAALNAALELLRYADRDRALHLVRSMAAARL